MIQTENISPVENVFSFSGLNNLSGYIVSEETIRRVKGRVNDLVSIMKNTVNNFLKNPEEMEAEFCLLTESYVTVSAEQHSTANLYDHLTRQKDGTINIQNLEEVNSLSGFMEENY